MISEALALHVAHRRVSHSWYIGVVSHGYGGFGWGRDGGVGWCAFGAKLQGGGRMLGDAGAFPV